MYNSIVYDLIEILTSSNFITAITALIALLGVIATMLSVYLSYIERTKHFQSFIYQKQFDSFLIYVDTFQRIFKEIYHRDRNSKARDIAIQTEHKVTDLIELSGRLGPIMPTQFNKDLNNIIGMLNSITGPLFDTEDFDQFDRSLFVVYNMNVELGSTMRKIFGIPGINSANELLLKSKKKVKVK